MPKDVIQNAGVEVVSGEDESEQDTGKKATKIEISKSKLDPDLVNEIESDAKTPGSRSGRSLRDRRKSKTDRKSGMKSKE